MPQSMDKETLVSQLRELDFLENYHSGIEDMLILLQLYNKFINIIAHVSNGWEFSQGNPGEKIFQPFGVNIPSIFGKVQPMTGFGSASSRLIKAGVYRNLHEISSIVERFTFGETEPQIGLGQLLIILEEVAKSSKRVGDSQRAYFEIAFKELLNPDTSSYLDLTNCWTNAQEKYNILY